MLERRHKGPVGKANSIPNSLGSSAVMISVSSAMVLSPFHCQGALLGSSGDNRRDGGQITSALKAACVTTGATCCLKLPAYEFFAREFDALRFLISRPNVHACFAICQTK